MMETKSVTTGGGPVKESEIIKQNLNLKQEASQQEIDEKQNQQQHNEKEITNYSDINGEEGDIINNINSDNELVLIDQKINVKNDIIQSSINTENITISPSHIESSNNYNNNNNNNNNNNININNKNNNYSNNITNNLKNNNNMCNTEINNKLSSPTAIKLKEPCTNGESERFDKSAHHEGNISLSPVGPSKSTNFLSPTRSDSIEEIDEINRFFETHPGALERWIKEKASSSTLSRIHATVEPVKSPRTPKRPSVTSDLFQLWLTSSSPVKTLSTTKAISRLYTAGQGLNSPIFGLLRCRSPTTRSSIGCRRHLENLDEGELFMELIRDVANELDIDVLCHKILVNVGLLTHADRGSLFLAKGPPNNRYLVAKLFDVTQNTALDDAVRRAKAEEIIIPFGVGIAGSVAQTKETINIKEAYTDPRFNCEIDIKTGYKTHVILSMPICNYEGDVIGVAQIINKTNDSGEFTERDVEVFRRYLTFCGIGIQNAQLFEMSVQEYRRNQILLNLARSIFEEQNNLECLVTKIMTEARELLKCERCSVYLLDLDCCEASHLERVVEKPSQPQQSLSRRQSHNVNVEDILEQQKCRANFAILFELGAENQSANVFRPSVDDLGKSTLAQIAQYVASTGQNLNIADVAEWLKDKPDIRRDDETSSSKTILCMPIVNGQKKVIGVAQLINKENSLQFTESDISIFEAFAIFCGLGIHNTQMYENACKLMAKQKVALECLSYHATAAPDQTVKLIQDTILPAESFNLYSFTFIDFDLSDDDTCRATVRMFLQLNLVQQFHVPYDVLCRWILSVRKNYRPVKYHNWRHALNVAQTMFAMLKTGKMERFMTDLQILGLLVACLCHDLDHRGTNNAFQTKSDSPLAILYTTSTMEHHHFDQCVMILNSEGNNIFQALSPDDYRNVMKVVETAILSTDLAMYFKKRNSFLDLIDNGEFDWQSEEKKELLCGMMMTACDVSAIAKPWEVQHRVAKMVADEFFDQGDLEKSQLNTQPIAMMDRERKDELPKMQVGFIDVICLPLYRVLSETFPWIRPLYEGTVDNRQHWQDLAEKVEMGLTWIDHDTIDKPVEEFSACSEEIKDIEFTVQTLNCTHPDQSDVTTPEKHRNKLSLRKPSALSKAVRAKLNKSLYNNSMSMQQQQQQLQQQQQQQDKEKQVVTPSTEDGTQDFSVTNAQVCSTATTSTGNVHFLKNEKHKRKSKLCLLL